MVLNLGGVDSLFGCGLVVSVLVFGLDFTYSVDFTGLLLGLVDWCLGVTLSLCYGVSGFGFGDFDVGFGVDYLVFDFVIALSIVVCFVVLCISCVFMLLVSVCDFAVCVGL